MSVVQIRLNLRPGRTQTNREIQAGRSFQSFLSIHYFPLPQMGFEYNEDTMLTLESDLEIVSC